MPEGKYVLSSADIAKSSSKALGYFYYNNKEAR